MWITLQENTWVEIFGGNFERKTEKAPTGFSRKIKCFLEVFVSSCKQGKWEEGNTETRWWTYKIVFNKIISWNEKANWMEGQCKGPQREFNNLFKLVLPTNFNPDCFAFWHALLPRHPNPRKPKPQASIPAINGTLSFFSHSVSVNNNFTFSSALRT